MATSAVFLLGQSHRQRSYSLRDHKESDRAEANEHACIYSGSVYSYTSFFYSFLLEGSGFTMLLVPIVQQSESAI